DIIEAAKKEDADIIGLSALMTTTMMEMKKVVELRNQEKLRAKIMIGGAVITQSFADEIGADGYSKDAQEAVEVAGKLLQA
ncbi:MAG: cobalamin-dependent protein, partial [Lachnospiraceae bacterium]|nr:cobalamin-dependent protein [Lachnospiraceae bacterium]